MRKRPLVRKRQLVELEQAYRTIASDAKEFAEEVVRQFEEILRQASLPLAVPIEHRIKTWASIAEKIERRRLEIQTIQDITDLIGVRAILLFRRDVQTACDLVADTFRVLSREDTIERLSESQFGYASIHFTVEVPADWLKVPTVQRFQGLKAELQVRTVAQHLWAASSHVLQYKQESSVPPPMRRAIYRVSALLETIDLEFERLLIEREEYAGTIDVKSEAETLNVDSLEKVLSTVWPPQNRSISEDFSDLLQDLFAFEVTTPDQLTKIVTKHRSSALKQDADQAKRELQDNQAPSDRLKSGVYFGWTGLTRIACESEFGKAFTNYLLAQFMPLSHLKLPEPIVNLLRGAQILRVCELAAVTENRLKGLLESNENYFRQIVEALGKVGLHLGMAEAHSARKLIDHPQGKILIEAL